MRIPNYYCPNCKQFKKRREVVNGGRMMYCRKCYCSVANVENMLLDYVQSVQQVIEEKE